MKIITWILLVFLILSFLTPSWAILAKQNFNRKHLPINQFTYLNRRSESIGNGTRTGGISGGK